MKNLLLSILQEFSPCASHEIYDYIQSDLFYEKGNLCMEDISIHKISSMLVQLEKENHEIVKFKCESGLNIRYGFTRFKYFLLDEPRFLRPQGYLKRCTRLFKTPTRLFKTLHVLWNAHGSILNNCRN